MIKPFEYYIKNKLVRKSIPDINIAKVLIQKAELRLLRIIRTKIQENEASMVFEDIYEILREASQSLMEVKGYKPYSHEAIIAFLKQENSLPLDKINILNNYRVLRNNSVYKAEKISLQKCQEALMFTKQTLPEIKKKFMTF